MNENKVTPDEGFTHYIVVWCHSKNCLVHSSLEDAHFTVTTLMNGDVPIDEICIYASNRCMVPKIVFE